MKEFDEFRFNRLEERAWRLTRELEARGKTEAEDTGANNEQEVVYSYEDIVIKSFKEDKEVALEMVIRAIEDYKNGEDNDLVFLRLNLSRFVTAHGYDVFEKAGLKRKAIDAALQKDTMSTDKGLINQMLGVLDIKERI